jgi:hypothetical protein
MRINGLVFLVWAALALVACQPPAAAPSTGTPALTGSISIAVPAPGMVYYSDLLTFSGTASGVAGSRFLLVLADAQGQVAASVVVPIVNDQWQAFVPFSVAEPTVLKAEARPVDRAVASAYAEAPVVVSPLSQRPEGRYGTIFSPVGEVVGGEMIPALGSVSGLAERSVTLQVLAPDDTVLHSQDVALAADARIDEVPFAADLPTLGITGPVRLRLLAPTGEALDEVELMLSVIAG